MTLKELLQKNVPLQGLHAGKRCFILGNGPSLKMHNLTLLENDVTIVASYFFRHPDAKRMRPMYWILADPSFWTKPKEYFVPAFDAAREVACDVKLFVPTWGIDFFLNVNTGPQIDLHFFHYDHSKDISSTIDFATGIPQYGQNVINIALMLAFYLGCNPIYFIGCDHDFMNVTRESFDAMQVSHFYKDPNQSTAGEHMSWDQWLGARARMIYEYDQLKQYASLHGFHVYNATPGGSFDNFPRVEFESLFAPSLNLLTIGKTPDKQDRRDAHHLGTAAIRLINAGDYLSADVLLDEAIRRNINTPPCVEGLHYIKALCLAKFGKYEEALLHARQDYQMNPVNREKSELLVKQIEEVL